MINLLHKTMFYMLLWLALSILAGCTTRYDAQVAQAQAQQAQAQAAIVQAQEQARMYQTLAEASKPNYWPLVVMAILAVVALLLVVRWHMVTVSHVAAGQSVQAQQLRLLPGDPGFNRALRIAASERGATPIKCNGRYYLVENGQRTEVKQLTVQRD